MIYQASPTYFKEFYGFRRYIILTLPSWSSPNSVSHQTDDFPFDINILASLKIGSPKRKVWSLCQHKIAINWGTSPFLPHHINGNVICIYIYMVLLYIFMYLVPPPFLVGFFTAEKLRFYPSPYTSPLPRSWILNEGWNALRTPWTNPC